MLLQLELLKVWSHLLKHYRNFVIHLSPASAADMPILIFDTPAFLATKPAHYVPFLTTLTNSSYFPLFLDERSCPLGIMPVQRDAFDRYEAAISGTRIHVWMDAFAFKRKAQQRAVTESGPEQHSNSNRHSSLTGQWVDGASAPPSCLSSPTSSAVPFSSSRRLSLSSWLSSYQRSGIDPSVHHAKYLAGWNQHSNLRWTDIERLPRRWFDHATHHQQRQQQQQQQQQEHQQLTNTTIAADGASTGGASGHNHSTSRAMSDAVPPSAPVAVAPASVAPISDGPAAVALPIVSADAATPAASVLVPPPSLSVHAPFSAPKSKSRLHRTMRRPSRSSTSASASAASSRSGSLSRDGAGSQPPSRPQSPHTDAHEQQAPASCPAATVETEGEANDA